MVNVGNALPWQNYIYIKNRTMYFLVPNITLLPLICRFSKALPTFTTFPGERRTHPMPIILHWRKSDSPDDFFTIQVKPRSEPHDTLKMLSSTGITPFTTHNHTSWPLSALLIMFFSSLDNCVSLFTKIKREFFTSLAISQFGLKDILLD